MSESLRAPQTPSGRHSADAAPPRWYRWVLAHPSTVARSLVSGTVGMPVGWRRRVDAVLVAFAVVLVGVAGAVGALGGVNERVVALWVGAEIAGDGSARVTEVIDYDFGFGDHHGIFRDMPRLASDAAVSVSSATAPDQFELIDMGTTTRIRIGDPSRTISGRHRYRIQYPLDAVAPGGQLAWDAVGTGWPVQLNNVEMHVVAPFVLSNPSCAQGTTGSDQPCDLAQPEPGHLAARIDTLEAGEGATLYAGAGRSLAATPGLPTPPSDAALAAGTSPILPALLATAVALIAAAAKSRRLRRRGRERVAADTVNAMTTAGTAGTALEPAEGAGGGEVRVDAGKLESLPTIAVAPPEELTPPQGGILLAEDVRSEHKVAWLIDAADHGYLEITDNQIRDNEPTMTLVRRLPADAPTAALLDQAFAGREQLGTYDPNFAAAWKALDAQLVAWQRSCGLWDPAGARRCNRARVLGVILAPLGLVLVIEGGATSNLPDSGWEVLVAIGALVAGASLAALISAWELRVRSPTGSGLWLRVESFRRFLAASEARHANEVSERGQLGQYTAWAVALGEIDCWSHAVAASTVAASRYVPTYDPRTVRALGSATSASSTAWSSSGGGSSGGGGGGGGGSGGGAGGGGGGSW
jgi:hypothetical protein